MRASAAVLASISALLLPGVGRAGVVIQFDSGDGRSTVTSQGNKVRFEKTGTSPQVAIFDGDAQKLIQLSPKEHTYQEFTQAEAKALHAQMEAMLASMPPERRAMVEARMKQTDARPANASTWEPSGKRDSIAGYACQGYRVLRQGKVREEECIIPWGSSPVHKDDLQGLLAFGKFMESFASTITGGHSGANVVQQITAAPGFPALIESVDDKGRHELRDRLVSVTHGNAGASTFAIPAGYEKAEKGPGQRRHP